MTPSATDHGFTADGTGVSAEMTPAISAPSATPTMPPHERQRDRLGEHLRHDVAALGAERLAQPDLARPLADHHQHDVHDDDAADEERQPDDADQDDGDAGRRLLKDSEHRVRREDAEVVRLPGLQPPLDAQRRPRLVLGQVHERGIARLDHQLERSARAEQLLEAAERNDHELVERVAEGRALLRADAEHAKVDAGDADDFVDRIRRPEQSIRDAPAEERHRTLAADLDRR